MKEYMNNNPQKYSLLLLLKWWKRFSRALGYCVYRPQSVLLCLCLLSPASRENDQKIKRKKFSQFETGDRYQKQFFGWGRTTRQAHKKRNFVTWYLCTSKSHASMACSHSKAKFSRKIMKCVQRWIRYVNRLAKIETSCLKFQWKREKTEICGLNRDGGTCSEPNRHLFNATGRLNWWDNRNCMSSRGKSINSINNNAYRMSSCSNSCIYSCTWIHFF